MKTDAVDYFKLVLSQLRRFGFLLESDAKLPSVCSLITGGPLRSSWWSHPLAQTIFQVNERLEDHARVLVTKLISGKVTFVHEKLWHEIFAIGRAREPWQTQGLSKPALTLLKMLNEQGTLLTDKLSWPAPVKTKPGDCARELERRLLIYAEGFHTDSGAHAKRLESWEHWRARIGFKVPSTSVAQAKAAMEERLRKMNLQFGASAKLPWA